jgi:hypothetical protein
MTRDHVVDGALARETIVVLSGSARIEVQGGPTLDLSVGDMAPRCPRVPLTRWLPSLDFKKVWSTRRNARLAGLAVRRRLPGQRREKAGRDRTSSPWSGVSTRWQNSRLTPEITPLVPLLPGRVESVETYGLDISCN